MDRPIYCSPNWMFWVMQIFHGTFFLLKESFKEKTLFRTTWRSVNNMMISGQHEDQWAIASLFKTYKHDVRDIKKEASTYLIYKRDTWQFGRSSSNPPCNHHRTDRRRPPESGSIEDDCLHLADNTGSFCRPLQGFRNELELGIDGICNRLTNRFS